MQAVLYVKENCQECERAKMLLESLGSDFLEYTLGKDFTRKEFVSEFGEEAQFPQLAFGTKHIGGLKEALQFLNEKNMINV